MYNILCVDDEPVILEVTKRMLDSSILNIIPISTVEEAMSYIKDNQVDVVVTDYDMKIDGIQFLKKIRLLYDKLPVIIFTGKSREEVVIAALNEGADFYLEKSGAPESMFAELRHLILRCIDRSDHERLIAKLEKTLKLLPV